MSRLLTDTQIAAMSWPERMSCILDYCVKSARFDPDPMWPLYPDWYRAFRRGLGIDPPPPTAFPVYCSESEAEGLLATIAEEFDEMVLDDVPLGTKTITVLTWLDTNIGGVAAT